MVTADRTGAAPKSGVARLPSQRAEHITPLSTRDLTADEVRDSLWLATRLWRDNDAEPGAQEPPDGREPPQDDGLSGEPVGRGDLSDPVPVAEKAVGRSTTTSEGRIELGDGQQPAEQAWPAPPALPQPRQLFQALRPMTRRFPSPWQKIPHEEATAIRAAQDGLWVIEWQNAPGRRFEVALVVDSSASMELWRQTAHEFRKLLAHLGAFRDIRTYLMDTTAPWLAGKPLRTEGAQGRACHWRDLLDPTGRRIVLVVTDAIGRAWHSGAVDHLLYQWGRTMPVAVVQTMAHRLWAWGGLHARRVRLSAPFPGATNQQLRNGGLGSHPAQRVDGPAMPVPVLGLSADWMSGWARLLNSTGREWVETTAALVRPQSQPQVAAIEPEEPLSPAQRVLRFRTIASVQAFQLAGLLAAAPLSLPLMKLVQQVLMPGSGLSALAEVMLGGLLRRLPASNVRSTPETVSYEFIDGVREELLACGERADTARVARVLDEYAGADVSALRNYRSAMESPDATPDPESSPEAVPYLRVQSAVFRALSGPYHRRARRLRRQLNIVDDDPVTRKPLPPGGSAGEAVLGSDTVTPSSKHPSDTSTSGPMPEEGDVTIAVSGADSGKATTETVSAPQIWGPVPLRNPDFVGRKQLLEQLRQRLTKPGTTAVLPEALHGMGGVGKSHTVVEYIYQHAFEYEVVWWISAEHPAQIRSSFVDLARRLGVPGSSADMAVPSVLEALRRGEPYSRWVLVFDNADRPDDVRPFFPAGAGHIVVTSRNSEWGGFAHAVEVDLFTRTESVELLHRRGGDLDDADADRLADALGDLPLAIEQAAAWRAQTGMPVPEYLMLLEQNRSELLETGATSDYQLPVAAAWNVSLARLREAHPAALQLLQVCAFFGPDPIARSLFSGVRDAPVPEDLADALRDPIKLNRAIREISRYSLAKIDHRNNTIQLHRLVQTVLKNRLSEAEQEDMQHAVHVLLVNGDPGDPGAADHWRSYSELLPHAVMSEAVGCNDRWVRKLVHNLVLYLLNSGDYKGARDLAAQAVETWTRSIGVEDIDTLEITRLYGSALRRLGQVDEAIRLNGATLEVMRQTVGEDHELFLGMLDTVAADRRSLGLFAEELQLQQQVYDRATQILGEDDPATLVYANNLASCLRLMGDFRGALARDMDTLRRRTAVLGDDHLQTFGSRNAHAIDLRETGQYIDAAKLQEQTLVRQREIFGNDHPSTLGAIRNLAVALRKVGRHQEAQIRAEECLVLYRSRLGERHADTATAQMTLSVELRILGNLDSSLQLARAGLRTFQETLGDQHPYSLIAATNMAVISRLRGDLDAARELDETTYAQLRTVFNLDHPFTLTCASNLASDMAVGREHDEARRLGADTFERASRVLGAEHPFTLGVALNLALDMTGGGDESESALLHSKTVARLRRVLGPEHPTTLAASQGVRANLDTDTMQL
jgi:tetratricopeptide (TPR) repeat protein